ncbi:helix-turn-helix domain-containing protein [Ruminococcus flavefaciens]|uniref:helix-turn-helix domain-containing protein n=1 Tax=Ruminococcus flavefaciens TaxID=1265 RepID=UPI0004637F48|nr:helix-turn-helix transcriptional regulator [Ruminococcus flavefaciens]
MDSFSEKIRGLRKERNKTQREVAEAIGTDQQTLRRYEHGDRRPDIEILSRLANYFNVSTDYLLGLTDYNTLSIEERNACEYIGLSKETIQALLFWSKSDELKAMKDVVSEIIKRITPDFIEAFFDYRSDEYEKERISYKLLEIYCKENKLKNISSIYNLSPQDRFTLEKIVNEALDNYGIDSAQSSFKFDKMLKELIFNMPLDNSYLEDRKNFSDEDIMIAYNIITTKHDYKKEFEDITAGRVNKNNKPFISKKLF